MKCPQCVAEGQRSRVFPGIGLRTGAYYPPFYDEDGQLHVHDGNTVTVNYTCSRGHTWVETSSGSCWCGWPNKAE